MTAVFSVVSVIYIMPIIIVLYNSFKRKIFISNRPFALPDAKSFVGLENYISGIEKIELPKAFGYSLFITVGSVFLIVLCTSMCAWYITRVKNMRPTAISVAILEAMWVWNDYLLPYLVLDIKKYKTIPIAIQYLKGGYGAIDMGAMMAMIVLAIIPIIIFYIACQKYIIEGVVAGAVKG